MQSAQQLKEAGPWWSRPALLLGLFSIYALIVWAALVAVGHFAPMNDPAAPATLDVAEYPKR